MFLLRVLFVCVIFSSWGCNLGPERRARILIEQGDSLLAQSTKIAQEWTSEYGQQFTPQKRAEFPSNRDLLRTSGQKILKLLDEDSRISRAAAKNYEEASTLLGNVNKGRAMALSASSIRKGVEVNELIQAQMRLAFDEEIRDAKTFDEKFMNLMQLIKQKRQEVDDQRNEAKRLLGQ